MVPAAEGAIITWYLRWMVPKTSSLSIHAWTINSLAHAFEKSLKPEPKPVLLGHHCEQGNAKNKNSISNSFWATLTLFSATQACFSESLRHVTTDVMSGP